MPRNCQLLFLFLGTLFFSISSGSARAQADSLQIISFGAYHNQKGLEYYNKGFFDLTPRNQDREARKNYDRAISEFKKVIAANPHDIEAHRNLARVYYVTQNFQEAAEQYKKVTTLNPSDVDSFIILSLAYLKLKRYDDAIQELENAKTQISNKSVINKINQYVQKIQKYKRAQ